MNVLLPALFFFTLLLLCPLFRPSPCAGEVFPTGDKGPIMQRPNPALTACSESDNTWHFGVRASAFLGNRMLPLHEMFSDTWEGEVHIDDRNLIHSKALAEAFAGRSGWELSFGVREQMSTRANRDTAEAFALLKGKKDLPTGKIYHAELEGDGFVAEELRIAVGRTAGAASGFSFGGALGLLHGERIQKGDLTGTLQATGPRSYNYALALDYAYDMSYLYDSPVSRAGMDGYGYAIDLGAIWRKDRFVVSLYGEDLFSTIYWSDVPMTTAVASNGRVSFDSQGYARYDPIISGFEGKRQVTQRLPPRLSAEAGYVTDTFMTSVTLDRMDGFYFPRLSAAVRSGERAGWWSVAVDLFFRTVGVGYEGETVGFHLFADHLLPEKVKALGLRLQLRR